MSEQQTLRRYDEVTPDRLFCRHCGKVGVDRVIPVAALYADERRYRVLCHGAEATVSTSPEEVGWRQIPFQVFENEMDRAASQAGLRAPIRIPMPGFPLFPTLRQTPVVNVRQYGYGRARGAWGFHELHDVTTSGPGDRFLFTCGCNGRRHEGIVIRAFVCVSCAREASGVAAPIHLIGDVRLADEAVGQAHVESALRSVVDEVGSGMFPGVELEVFRDLCRRVAAYDPELAQAVGRELADYDMILGEVSKVYDTLTRGRISKQNTRADAVIAEVESIQEEEQKEIVAEAREEWEAERTAAVIDPDQLRYEVSVLRPKPGDVLVLYAVGGVTPYDLSRIESKVPAGVHLIVLESHDRLEHLSVERLRELGLQRIRR